MICTLDNFTVFYTDNGINPTIVCDLFNMNPADPQDDE